MKWLILGIAAVPFAACALAPQPASSASGFACPHAGWGRGRLDGLKADGFEIAKEAERQASARAVTACLANPDPALRDGIAFEALAHMLRAKELSDETKRALLVDLTKRLAAPDPSGFEQPFAALALSEVVRADRIEAFLSEDELVKPLVDAQHWFVNVRGYCGFDGREGWRHGVLMGLTC